MRLISAASILALASGFAPALTHAEETSYQENRLDALHYRIPKGSFFLSLAEGQFLNDKVTLSPGGGIYTYHGFFLQGNVGYGITDSLSVTLGASMWNGTNPTAAATPYEMGDTYPMINYRYYGDLKGRAFGSAYVGVTPPWGSQSSYANENSFNSGQTAVLFGTHWQWVKGVHEFGVDASGTYGGAVTFTDSVHNGFYNNTSNAFWYADLGGQYRYHFLERFFAAPFLSLQSPYSVTYNYPNESPVYQETHNYPWHLSEGIQFGWLICPTFGVSIAYTHDGYTKNVTPIASSGLSPTGYSYNQDLLAIVLGLQL